VFTVEERSAVRDHVLRLAGQDLRIVAAAEVGSLARGSADRWSDLDLTFAVTEGIAVEDVLADWTTGLATAFGATELFDLPLRSTVYRVFLVPGCLQVDLSFTPVPDFREGAGFRLLFGTAAAGRGTATPQPARDVFGLAVHHGVRARVSIERGRHWQAEHWISGVREQAFVLACRRHGLEPSHGRGYDDLPADVRAEFDAALVRALTRDELLRSLAAAIDVLRRQSDEVAALAAHVEQDLLELSS
jgi:predicted nucleotidyltransferase